MKNLIIFFIICNIFIQFCRILLLDCMIFSWLYYMLFIIFIITYIHMKIFTFFQFFIFYYILFHNLNIVFFVYMFFIIYFTLTFFLFKFYSWKFFKSEQIIWYFWFSSFETSISVFFFHMKSSCCFYLYWQHFQFHMYTFSYFFLYTFTSSTIYIIHFMNNNFSVIIFSYLLTDFFKFIKNSLFSIMHA